MASEDIKTLGTTDDCRPCAGPACVLLLDAALLASERIIVEGRCYQEVLNGGMCCITSARASCLGYADARFGVRLNLAGGRR